MSFDLKTTRQPKHEISPQLKKLNALIDQIEQQKVNLAEWQNVKSEIQHYAGQKLIPVYQEYYVVLFKQLDHLWNSLSKIEFSKADLVQVDHKIQSLIIDLQSNSSLSSAQLERIEEISLYYQQQSNDVKTQLSDRSSSGKTCSLKGKENSHLDDSNHQDSDYDWDELNHADQYQQARDQAKLKRQQDKQAQAEKLVNQSLKTVYLKIASIIHPDREPDETKKAEKTKLLQSANEAYEQQDLFALLKLQLEIEYQHSNSNKTITQDQVKYYQQALEAQSLTLKMQIQALIDQLVWTEKAKITVQKSKGKLEVSKLYQQIDADVSAIKQQLKAERQRLIYMQQERGLLMLMEHEVL